MYNAIVTVSRLPEFTSSEQSDLDAHFPRSPIPEMREISGQVPWQVNVPSLDVLTYQKSLLEKRGNKVEIILVTNRCTGLQQGYKWGVPNHPNEALPVIADEGNPVVYKYNQSLYESHLIDVPAVTDSNGKIILQPRRPTHKEALCTQVNINSGERGRCIGDVS